MHCGERHARLTDALNNGRISAQDQIEFGDLDEQFQQSTFAGHFIEVAVHRMTGEIRVRRMLAVCAAGRILNPKTARSQVIGAMTMGLGAALMESCWLILARVISLIMIWRAMRSRYMLTSPSGSDLPG